MATKLLSEEKTTVEEALKELLDEECESIIIIFIALYSAYKNTVCMYNS